MSWEYVIGLAVHIGVRWLLAPKPQETSDAATLSDFKPTISEGKSIPVIFGTRVIKDPNLLWYGDFRSIAIKKSGGKNE